MKILPVLLLCSLQSAAQRIELLAHNDSISIRGLSVVNDKIIWVSGSNGTVGRSIDSGRSWQWITVPNYEKRDFRDIEAFNANEAVIMAVAEPALILKTKDAGKNWSVVFEDNTKGMFLDAMDFRGSQGAVIGDPVDHKIFLAFTDNKGDSWKVSGLLNEIRPAEGEAFFASSGTNICLAPKEAPAPVFVSGGMKSILYYSSASKRALPLVQGTESRGANSIALADARSGIVVGGDFRKDTATAGNCVLFTLYPYSLRRPQVPPHGYRSCVDYVDTAKRRLIACGTSGVDISSDGGMNWKLISSESFHVCQKAKKGNTVFLAGAGGRIGKLIW